MLTHYLEINCKTLPNETGWMLGKLFQQLHGFLSSTKTGNIAVALPDMKSNHPGDRLRLFGPAEKLNQLLSNSRLQPLEAGGAIEISQVRQVPAHTSFAVYMRNRQSEKGSPAQLKKRMGKYLKHLESKGIEIDPVLLEERKKRMTKAYRSDRAFISLGSRSTGQRLQLVITQKMTAESTAGHFSSYGLATHQSPATVPVF